jgi:hypothetical protein
MTDPERQLPQSADGALDELLRQAAWPQPDPAVVERLRGHWRSLVAERRRRSLRRWMSAAAAAVLIAAGSWMFWPRPPQDDVALPGVPPHGDRELPVADRDRKSAPDPVAEHRGDAPSAEPAAQETGYVWSRPATAYQEFVVAAV